MEMWGERSSNSLHGDVGREIKQLSSWRCGERDQINLCMEMWEERSMD
jgi:hypothetical protein